MQSSVKISGFVKWKLIDRSTNQILKEGGSANTVTYAHIENLAKMLETGSGTIDKVNLMKAGTTDTEFNIYSTDLTTPIKEEIPTITRTGTTVKMSRVFVFDEDVTIEELGMFDTVSNRAIAFNHSISQLVAYVQALEVNWEIYYS